MKNQVIFILTLCTSLSSLCAQSAHTNNTSLFDMPNKAGIFTAAFNFTVNAQHVYHFRHQLTPTQRLCRLAARPAGYGVAAFCVTSIPHVLLLSTVRNKITHIKNT